MPRIKKISEVTDTLWVTNSANITIFNYDNHRKLKVSSSVFPSTLKFFQEKIPNILSYKKCRKKTGESIICEKGGGVLTPNGEIILREIPADIGKDGIKVTITASKKDKLGKIIEIEVVLEGTDLQQKNVVFSRWKMTRKDKPIKKSLLLKTKRFT